MYLFRVPCSYVSEVEFHYVCSACLAMQSVCAHRVSDSMHMVEILILEHK